MQQPSSWCEVRTRGEAQESSQRLMVGARPGNFEMKFLKPPWLGLPNPAAGVLGDRFDQVVGTPDRGRRKMAADRGRPQRAGRANSEHRHHLGRCRRRGCLHVVQLRTTSRCTLERYVGPGVRPVPAGPGWFRRCGVWHGACKPTLPKNLTPACRRVGRSRRRRGPTSFCKRCLSCCRLPAKGTLLAEATPLAVLPVSVLLGRLTLPAYRPAGGVRRRHNKRRSRGTRQCPTGKGGQPGS